VVDLSRRPFDLTVVLVRAGAELVVVGGAAASSTGASCTSAPPVHLTVAGSVLQVPA
jgi:hypothetical protein